jgi:phytoene dehydrogenase-like protein
MTASEASTAPSLGSGPPRQVQDPGRPVDDHDEPGEDVPPEEPVVERLVRVYAGLCDGYGDLEVVQTEAADRQLHAELSTPLSTRHFANYEHGEIYGLRSTPARLLERGLRPRTAVAGLFLTGQDAAGLGVSHAMFGGLLSASLILGRNLMGEVMKP